MTQITKIGGCGDANCQACAARGNQPPMPTMLAEFGLLYEQLMAMTPDGPPDQAPHREITIAVSDVTLFFMAWLDRMIENRARGSLRPFGVRIDSNDPADIDRASRYLAQMLPWSLENDLTALCLGQHPLLFAPECNED